MKRIFSLLTVLFIFTALAFSIEKPDTNVVDTSGSGQAVIAPNLLVGGFSNGTYTASAGYDGNLGLATVSGGNKDSAEGFSFAVSNPDSALTFSAGEVGSSTDAFAFALGKHADADTSVSVAGAVAQITGNQTVLTYDNGNGFTSYAGAAGAEGANASYSASSKDIDPGFLAISVSGAKGDGKVSGFTGTFANLSGDTAIAGGAVGSSASANSSGQDHSALAAVQGGLSIATDQNYGNGVFGYTESNGAYAANTGDKGGSVSGFTSGLGITIIKTNPGGSSVSTYSSITTVTAPVAPNGKP